MMHDGNLKLIKEKFFLPRFLVLLLDEYIFYEDVIEFAPTNFTSLKFLFPHVGSDQENMSKAPEVVRYEGNYTFIQYIRKPTKCTFSKFIF
jgi:hypothetical protein